jgi:hypothetical protein
LSFDDLAQERKRQLRRISEIRGGRDILVFAADLNKGAAPISIGYADLLPIRDQLDNLRGRSSTSFSNPRAVQVKQQKMSSVYCGASTSPSQ